jgi:ABC-type molybdate transport system substrate-binding protein
MAMAPREAIIRLNCTRKFREKDLKPVTAIGYRRPVLVIALGIALIGAIFAHPVPVFAQAPPSKALAAIPPDKDTDLKFYRADGIIRNGAEALEHMTSDAGLVLWVAGNQFFAMDEVIGVFQKAHPGVTVGLITLPPGLLLSAIQAGGWTYNGKEYRGTPDVYASASLGHLKQLSAAGLMSQYETYTHNELQLMVAKGNPKKIAGIDDLVRSDVRTSLPNPVDEGIMQFYARKVLERHGVWTKIVNGRECVSCQTTERNWFTAVHHRETPQRIRDDISDAGIVWKTEIMEALRQGAPVEAVELPPADSLRDEVFYAIGPLKNARNKQNADAYLAFLTTAAGQDAYAKFGFVKARSDELKLKPID